MQASTYSIGCDENCLILRRVEPPPGGEFEDQPEGKLEIAVLGLVDLEWSHPPVESDEDEDDDGPLHESGGQRICLNQPPGRRVGHYLLHDPPDDQTNAFYRENEPAYYFNFSEHPG